VLDFRILHIAIAGRRGPTLAFLAHWDGYAAITLRMSHGSRTPPSNTPKLSMISPAHQTTSLSSFGHHRTFIFTANTHPYSRSQFRDGQHSVFLRAGWEC
jgi:hypothetical protein